MNQQCRANNNYIYIQLIINITIESKNIIYGLGDIIFSTNYILSLI